MNAQRRQDIQRAIDLLEEAKTILETSIDDEQGAFDNMPESLQYSERGQKMEEYISYLEDAVSDIEDAMQNAGECIN